MDMLTKANLIQKKLPLFIYMPDLIVGRFAGTIKDGDKSIILYYPQIKNKIDLLKYWRKPKMIRNVPTSVAESPVFYPTHEDADPNGVKIITVGPLGERGFVDEIFKNEQMIAKQIINEIERLKHEKYFTEQHRDMLEKDVTKRIQQLRETKDIYEGEKRGKKPKRPLFDEL